MIQRCQVKIGSLVSLDKFAFGIAALEYNSKTLRFGIVLDIISTREILNLDTDEEMCEIMLDTGEREFFYKEDVVILNEK